MKTTIIGSGKTYLFNVLNKEKDLHETTKALHGVIDANAIRYCKIIDDGINQWGVEGVKSMAGESLQKTFQVYVDFLPERELSNKTVHALACVNIVFGMVDPALFEDYEQKVD